MLTVRSARDSSGQTKPNPHAALPHPCLQELLTAAHVQIENLEGQDRARTSTDRQVSSQISHDAWSRLAQDVSSIQAGSNQHSDRIEAHHQLLSANQQELAGVRSDLDHAKSQLDQDRAERIALFALVDRIAFDQNSDRMTATNRYNEAATNRSQLTDVANTVARLEQALSQERQVRDTLWRKSFELTESQSLYQRRSSELEIEVRDVKREVFRLRDRQLGGDPPASATQPPLTDRSVLRSPPNPGLPRREADDSLVGSPGGPAPSNTRDLVPAVPQVTFISPALALKAETSPPADRPGDNQASLANGSKTITAKVSVQDSRETSASEERNTATTLINTDTTGEISHAGERKQVPPQSEMSVSTDRPSGNHAATILPDPTIRSGQGGVTSLQESIEAVKKINDSRKAKTMLARQPVEGQNGSPMVLQPSTPVKTLVDSPSPTITHHPAVEEPTTSDQLGSTSGPVAGFLLWPTAAEAHPSAAKPVVVQSADSEARGLISSTGFIALPDKAKKTLATSINRSSKPSVAKYQVQSAQWKDDAQKAFFIKPSPAQHAPEPVAKAGIIPAAPGSTSKAALTMPALIRSTHATADTPESPSAQTPTTSNKPKGRDRFMGALRHRAPLGTPTRSGHQRQAISTATTGVSRKPDPVASNMKAIAPKRPQLGKGRFDVLMSGDEDDAVSSNESEGQDPAPKTIEPADREPEGASQKRINKASSPKCSKSLSSSEPTLELIEKVIEPTLLKTVMEDHPTVIEAMQASSESVACDHTTSRDAEPTNDATPLEVAEAPEDTPTPASPRRMSIVNMSFLNDVLPGETLSPTVAAIPTVANDLEAVEDLLMPESPVISPDPIPSLSSMALVVYACPKAVASANSSETRPSGLGKIDGVRDTIILHLDGKPVGYLFEIPGAPLLKQDLQLPQFEDLESNDTTSGYPFGCVVAADTTEGGMDADASKGATADTKLNKTAKKNEKKKRQKAQKRQKASENASRVSVSQNGDEGQADGQWSFYDTLDRFGEAKHGDTSQVELDSGMTALRLQAYLDIWESGGDPHESITEIQKALDEGPAEGLQSASGAWSGIAVDVSAREEEVDEQSRQLIQDVKILQYRLRDSPDPQNQVVVRSLPDFLSRMLDRPTARELMSDTSDAPKPEDNIPMDPDFGEMGRGAGGGGSVTGLLDRKSIAQAPGSIPSAGLTRAAAQSAHLNGPPSDHSPAASALQSKGKKKKQKAQNGTKASVEPSTASLVSSILIATGAELMASCLSEIG